MNLPRYLNARPIKRHGIHVYNLTGPDRRTLSPGRKGKGNSKIY